MKDRRLMNMKERLNTYKGLVRTLKHIVIISRKKEDYRLIKLHCDELNKIPLFIENFNDIIELYIHGFAYSNYMFQVPEWFDQLQNLEILDLSRCDIRTVPDVIGQLKNLKYLNLAENFFEELPEFIYQLPRLEYLKLPEDSVSYLNERLLDIKNLKYVCFPYEGKYNKNEIRELLSKEKEEPKAKIHYR